MSKIPLLEYRNEKEVIFQNCFNLPYVDASRLRFDSADDGENGGKGQV